MLLRSCAIFNLLFIMQRFTMINLSFFPIDKNHFAQTDFKYRYFFVLFKLVFLVFTFCKFNHDLFYLNFHLFIYLFYLKGRETSRSRRFSVYSVNAWSSQDRARSPELCLDFPPKWQGSKCLSYHLLPPRICFSR